MAETIDTFATATEMLAALSNGQISAAELAELHIARIERLDPVLNAIPIRCFEAARARAAAADRSRAAGETGALLGLPLTIKDCIDVAGLLGTAGVPDFAERVPDLDAPVSARALQAGAVLLGKTNVPPMAGDWQADNPIFGRTNNPWDLNRTPGGSTGGGAAALAAGLTPLEFGSDIGGSIRVPAAFCGVFGHRPSETALPRSGHFPGTPLPNAGAVMGVLGPLARSAEDLELAFDVVAGPELGEDVAWRLEIGPARADTLAGFRVAVLPWPAWLPLDAEIAAGQARLAEQLRALGATVGTAQPDAFGDGRAHFALYLSLLGAMTSPGLGPEERAAMAAGYRSWGDEFGAAMAAGLDGNPSDYIIWHAQREVYRHSYRAFFRDWDILLAPITLVPPFEHTQVPMDERTLTIDGVTVPYLFQVAPPGFATLAGQPATPFPIRLNHAGLPLGLQAIGPYLEDRTPLRFAQLVAREFGGFQRPPAFAE